MLVQGHAVDQSGLEAALLSLQAQAEKAFKGNMMPRGVFTSGFLNRDGEHVTYIHVPVDARPSQRLLNNFPMSVDIPLSTGDGASRLVDVIIDYPELGGAA